MSEERKYVTFRDLRTINKAKQEPVDSATSTPSISSSPSDTSISSIAIPSINPKPSKKPKIDSLKPASPVAPERDFQRIPNSVTRRALPEGTFRGKSKQVWDYLWSVSRGAVTPARSVRKSRREIKAGSGLGSMVTVDAALEHLQGVGLIRISPAIGSLVGNEYEVFTPEETYTSTSSIPSTSSSTSLTQNLVHLDIPESSISSTTQVAEKTGAYSPPNTFFKTNTDDEYTHTANLFFEPLAEAARVCVRGELNLSNQEQGRWRELGQLLADELRNAAGRTEAVSSAPAFLAAHLRRWLSPQSEPTGAEASNQKTHIEANQVRDRKGMEGKSQSKRNEPVPKVAPQGGSKFSLEECRRFADHLRKTEQGITNPGGYATIIHRTGEADKLIEQFLKPAPSPPAPVDASQCPDCKGTGYWYPGGTDKGVALCKHEKLLTREQV